MTTITDIAHEYIQGWDTHEAIEATARHGLADEDRDRLAVACPDQVDEVAEEIVRLCRERVSSAEGSVMATVREDLAWWQEEGDRLRIRMTEVEGMLFDRRGIRRGGTIPIDTSRAQQRVRELESELEELRRDLRHADAEVGRLAEYL